MCLFPGAGFNMDPVVPPTEDELVQTVRLDRYEHQLLKLREVHVFDTQVPSHLGNEGTQQMCPSVAEDVCSAIVS